MLVLEFLDKELHKYNIEILSSKGSVTVSGLNLKNSTGNLKNGNIESSTSKIVNGENLSVSFVHTEGQSGSGWLVNNSLYFKISNLSSVLGGLSLRIIEISWDGDNGLLA